MKKLTPEQQRFADRFTSIVNNQRPVKTTLDEMERKFVHEYLQGFDAEEAATRAGYGSSSRTRAEWMLKTARIQAAIARRPASESSAGIVH